MICHLISHHLFKGNGSGPGGEFPVTDGLCLRAGGPLEGGRVGGPETALFNAAPDGGDASVDDGVQIHSEQAGILAIQKRRK